MSLQQRDALDRLLRDAPLDLGGCRDRVAAVAAVFICVRLVLVRAGGLELCSVLGLGCGGLAAAV